MLGSENLGEGSVPTGGNNPDGGSGSGSVNSVTATLPGVVDNSDPANPVIEVAINPPPAIAEVGAVGAVARVALEDHTHAGYVDFFRPGAPLPNADTTVNPSSDFVSSSTLPAATLTADRTLSVGVSGSPPIGMTYAIIRRDLTAHAYDVMNLGPAGGLLAPPGQTHSFPASPIVPTGMRISFDGTNWNFVDYFFVQGGTFAAPTDPLFLNPVLWLRADLGLTQVSGKGSAWVNQGSLGNTYAQSNAALRPTFVASSVGGRPGLTFAPTLLLTSNQTPWAAGADRSLIVIAKPIAQLSGSGMVFSTRSAAPTWSAIVDKPDGLTFQCYSDLATAVSKTVPPLPLDGLPHAYEWYTQVGFSPVVVADGAPQVTAPSGGFVDQVKTDSGGVAASQVGNYFGANGGFEGDICEIIGVAGIMTSLQKLLLRAYISDRYGLVIA